MILVKTSARSIKKIIFGCDIRLTIIRCKSLDYSPNAKLNKTLTDKYMCLPVPECLCQVTYVWIDGTGQHLRSKCRTLNFNPTSYKEVPTRTFDGRYTYHADPKNSDTFICPVAMYNDPMRRGNNKLVLCDTYKHDHKPTKTNLRQLCLKSLNTVCDQHPMLGIEQRYHFMDLDNRPLGWPVILGEPAPAGDYYCGVGANRVYGREIAESHYRACLYAGINLGGINPEVNLSQWEFRVGATEGIKAADDLWMARYLLWRIAEDYGVAVTFRPYILPNWRDSCCHVNFSTKAMRADCGLDVIKKAIRKLEKTHHKHMKLYHPFRGTDQCQKLTGEIIGHQHDCFSDGVGDRKFSIRIPQEVADKKRGWFEDRRPSSNCDPYQVFAALINTCLLE